MPRDLIADSANRSNERAIVPGINFAAQIIDVHIDHVSHIHADHVIVNPLRINRDAANELEHNLLLCYTGNREYDELASRMGRAAQETVIQEFSGEKFRTGFLCSIAAARELWYKAAHTRAV